MIKAKGFESGARVRYTGAFLRNTGQSVGPAGRRRGTVVGPVPGMGPDFVGVRWDDESLADYDADPELRELVREHGQAVNGRNLEKSPR